MSDRQSFRLDSPRQRDAAKLAVIGAPDGWEVVIRPAKRSLDQNAIFHALCDDIAKARPEWNGMAMDAEDWKQLLVLSHAIATGGGGVRLAQDIEGEGLVQLRESTARMDKARASSLIDYTMAFAAQRGIPIGEAA